MACAPVAFAASRIFAPTRYDSRAAAGPMRTASSASRTWRAPASASEYTATVAMPSRRAVLMTRQAISPRLAMRILVNMASVLSARGAREGERGGAREGLVGPEERRLARGPALLHDAGQAHLGCARGAELEQLAD